MWQTLGGPLDLQELSTMIAAVQNTLGGLQGALARLSALLGVAASRSLNTASALDALTAGISALIDALIRDLFEFNVAVAVHLNLSFNPDWVWSRTTQNPALVTDYVHDGAWPLRGNGIDGFLADLISSAADTSDPFRPISDADTAVRGILIVRGVDDFADVEQLHPLFDLLPQLAAMKDLLSPGKIQGANAARFASVSRIGSAALDSFLAGILDAGPASERSKDLGLDPARFSPKPGNWPKWLSVPVAAVFPPVQSLLLDLQGLANALRSADSTPEVLSKLLSALRTQVAELQQVLTGFDRTLDALDSAFAFLEESHYILLRVSSGGVGAFFSAAAAAEGKPDFGETGICVGISLLATNPDAEAALESFLQIFRVPLDADATRREQLDATWGGIA